MTNEDLKIILQLPSDYGKMYVDMLCVRDETFFSDKKVAEIDPSDERNYTDVNALWEVFAKNKNQVNADLFGLA